MKAIKTNKARGKSTDFWSLPLPQETKQYVPKMLALSDILKNSKRYGVRLPTTDESRALARVHLSSPVEMAKVADMGGDFRQQAEDIQRWRERLHAGRKWAAVRDGAKEACRSTA